MSSQEYPIRQFLQSEEDYQRLPLLYTYLERYGHSFAYDGLVDDLNMVPSQFHQTTLHTVGYVHKKAAYIYFDASRLVYPIQHEHEKS